MKKYTLGLDFGTLSARAVLVDTASGEALEHESVFSYPHGVMTELCGRALPKNYALQHPDDYEEALVFLLCDMVVAAKKNGISPESIVGIGVDFTTCTVLPTDKQGVPLCKQERFANDPHAYVKLWKHHGAEKYLPEINKAVAAAGTDMLDCSGGVMSSEFMIPKIYETYVESPEVYDATALFYNAGDYVCSRLAGGASCHSMAYASIKEHYDKSLGGYPSREFFKILGGEGFENVVEEKLNPHLNQVGERIGGLSHEWAERTGLSAGIAIAPALIDAQSSFGAAGLSDGSSLLVLGTSAVFAVNTSSKEKVRGVLSQGVGSAIPEMMTLESGLSAMGDLFAWFVDNCVPAHYTDAAKARGMNIHAYLRSLAEQKKVGQSGLITLDWWHGNRSVIQNDRLSGMIVGLRLSTPPEDIYRALIESTAYGLRRIMENYEEQGVAVKNIVAAGGIAYKDEMLMQIFADVFNRDIHVIASQQSASHGAAVYGATAAGVYANVIDASAAMRCGILRTYSPIAENSAAYERLYTEYKKLYEYFGHSTLTDTLADMRG